jgi:beta-glucanase (GH16 family)
VTDSSEPSGEAPPGANAMTGYSQTYSDDFSGSALSGWSAYSGQPSGDAGAQWGGASHAVVGGGILSLDTFQDSAYNNEWVAGGVSQNLTRTYGAYFVRSRVTGAGPTNVELLFPATGWPPEVDFNETSGVSTGTSATTIWAVNSSGNKSQVQVQQTIDMTQWHTWGVIWTPTSVTYTVDGRAWGTVTNASEVPQVPMRLDLQQQTWCSSGFACPSVPQSMQIDWVVEYAAN